jgi:hypothetical protein
VASKNRGSAAPVKTVRLILYCREECTEVHKYFWVCNVKGFMQQSDFACNVRSKKNAQQCRRRRRSE